MLKQISILIVFASMVLTSCQTMEFSDVMPETAGSAMGDIKLGKEGVDFFVIPGKPVTPEQISGAVPVPPENIVVFKTRERSAPYKAMRAVGAPARGTRTVLATIYNKVTEIAFGWLKWGKKKDEEQGEAQGQSTQGNATPARTVPIRAAYPEAMLPADTFDERTNRSPAGRQAARDLHPGITNLNGG